MAENPGVHHASTGAAERSRAAAGGEDPGDAANLESLVGAVARGDQQAFARLYEHVSGSVFGLVLRIVRDHAQSEEVSQEVLVDVWRKAAQYEPGKGSARTWILTFAHRRAVDRVRSVQATANREMRDATQSGQHSLDDVSETVLADFERLAVRRCVETLTKLQRESIEVTYYRGYSSREAASMLGTPVPTLKTRLRDGLIRLRDCLGVGT